MNASLLAVPEGVCDTPNGEVRLKPDSNKKGIRNFCGFLQIKLY